MLFEHVDAARRESFVHADWPVELDYSRFSISGLMDDLRGARGRGELCAGYRPPVHPEHRKPVQSP